MTSRPHCCYIDDQGFYCERLAKWDVTWDETGDPYVGTHACDAHLGKLIPDDRRAYVNALEINAIDALADLAET